MTRTLYLHAGPPKTGSTSIQTFFRDNAVAFQRQGFFRPSTGTELHSHIHLGLVNAFNPGHATSPEVEKLAAELQARNLPEKVFISAEMFATRLGNRACLNALKSFCRRLGYRLHIIIFIRPQAPLLNSLFTQHVKNWRPVTSVEAFLAVETEHGRHHYASHFRNVLDDSEVDFSALPFGRAMLLGSLDAAMCSVMGLDASTDSLVKPEATNFSPGPRTVAAFQRLRRKANNEFLEFDQYRLAPLTQPLLHAAAALGWNAEKFGGISIQQQHWINDAFRTDNDALAQRLWSKRWDQIFADGETLAPPFNIFDPADAAPSQRREFREFIEQSLTTIAEFAGVHHGQGKRM